MKKGGRPASRAARRARRRVSARELALTVLAQTDSRAAYSDRLLETKLRESGLSGSDAALATTLVQGTLRYRGLIDHHLSGLAREGLPRLPAAIRAALRIGAYQILVLSRIPDSAAVDESVKLAKRYGHPGTAGLVNAVLRRLARGDREPLPSQEADPVTYLSVVTSHPSWLVARWLRRFGSEEAEALLQADNTEPKVSVRPNAHRISPGELEQALRSEGQRPEPGPNGGPVFLLSDGGFVASRSPLFRGGLLSLQDEAEASVPILLDPKPGEWVLDLCAAPGGKASQIAERIAPGGFLVAVEIAKGRARALRENLVHRLRLPGVGVVCADGRTPPLKRRFDRVLLDAPCTGLGVLRRRADARWRKQEEDIAGMADLQRELLQEAAGLVRSGGVLVYSVCSFEPEETDQIVEPFLKAHPEFTREDARPLLPSGFAGDGPELRAFPHVHGTDGVYAVRLRRR